MEYKRVCCFLLLLVVCITAQPGPPRQRRGGTADDSEQWGYTTVREGAHMFWWLYRTTHTQGHASRPLLIWIQGGPGLSGTALGNFAEIGPLDANMTARQSTWLREVNLLFFDSPVGTGFSYLTNNTLIPRFVEQIANDLYTAFLDVIDSHGWIKNVPIYIFGQSYGGKMAPAFACRIVQARDTDVNAPQVDLRGVGLGNGYTSPKDTMASYAPYLYEMSFIDGQGYMMLDFEISNTLNFIDNNDMKSALQGTMKVLETIGDIIPGVNLYDSGDFYPYNKTDDQPVSTCDLTGPTRRSKMRSSRVFRYSIYDDDFSEFMNERVKQKLQIVPKSVNWNDDHDEAVFNALSEDISRSATHFVDELLNRGVHVVVYQGQRDIICGTAGALSWIRNLSWQHLPAYLQSSRLALFDPDTQKIEMFAKDLRNLHMYWILNAGHAVPADSPETALRMLQRILETT